MENKTGLKTFYKAKKPCGKAKTGWVRLQKRNSKAMTKNGQVFNTEKETGEQGRL
jgi:hypothetical protein